MTNFTYIIEELHRKFQEKFSDKILELEAFLYIVLPAFEVVCVPEEAIEAEAKIRDPKDRPILRAALNAGADLFLTGDKDFLESAVEEPRIISVQTFLDMQPVI
ncbi:MAG: putative toxin-antitoxin system toxin component, PIN family [Bacillota bacterium]|nr:putative toxin-antitoxin system toxin component, PIN family [Bacillota bacterium]